MCLQVLVTAVDRVDLGAESGRSRVVGMGKLLGEQRPENRPEDNLGSTICLSRLATEMADFRQAMSSSGGRYCGAYLNWGRASHMTRANLKT